MRESEKYMRVRIDLKIFIFLILFYLTNQIEIYLTIMFFCIIHELGHIIVGLILNQKPEKLEIMPYGLTISFKVNPDDLNLKIKKGNILELKKIIIALAGPIVSLSLSIIFTWVEPLYITKQDAVYSNILILLFNLIPLYPLDGGRILKGVLHIEFGNKVAKKLINKISNIAMILLTIACSIAVYYFKNIAIFLICVFLWVITLQENKKFQNEMKMYEMIEKNTKT